MDSSAHGTAASPGVAPVTPWIISRDTDAEISFLGDVFGAAERPGTRIMNGDSVVHVEIELAGGSLMLFDLHPDWPETPAHTRVYVAHLSETLARARARGARVVTEATAMPFGDLVARFRDPQGHLWWVHEHVEEVSADELAARFADPLHLEALAYVGRTLGEELSRRGNVSSRTDDGVSG